MADLGNVAGYGRRSVFVFTATAGQVTFTGKDLQNITLNYDANQKPNIWVDGRITSPLRFTSTDNSTITFDTAFTGGEEVIIEAFGTFAPSNTYTKAEIEGLLNNTTVWRLLSATAAQTVLTGADSYGLALNYTGGMEQVFVNGRKLTPIADYTRTSSSTITLLTALSAGDNVDVVQPKLAVSTPFYTTAQSDAMFGLKSKESLWTPLTRITQPSATANIDFAIPADIKLLRVMGVARNVSTVAALAMRVSTNNGSSFITGGSDYAYNYSTVDGSTYGSGAAAAGYFLLGGGQSPTDEFFTFDLSVYPGSATRKVRFGCLTRGQQAGAAGLITSSSGRTAAAQLVTNLRFIMHDGTNIAEMYAVAEYIS